MTTVYIQYVYFHRCLPLVAEKVTLIDVTFLSLRAWRNCITRKMTCDWNVLDLYGSSSANATCALQLLRGFLFPLQVLIDFFLAFKLGKKDPLKCLLKSEYVRDKWIINFPASVIVLRHRSLTFFFHHRKRTLFLKSRIVFLQQYIVFLVTANTQLPSFKSVRYVHTDIEIWILINTCVFRKLLTRDYF